MEVALVTSTAWKIPPSSASPVFTSQQTTRQPSSAKRSAVAFPIPLAAPVTITTLFFSPVSIMMTILDNKHHLRGCWSVLILLTIVSQVGAQQDDLALARSYAERNELPAAEAEARRVVAANPESADAHFLLGYILFRQQTARESLAEYTAGAKYRKPSAADLRVVGADYVLLADYE